MGFPDTTSNFEFDSRRERVLAEFLDAGFYPHAARSWAHSSDKERQQAGEDSVVEFKWLSESKIVDEKAQSSDKWINSPRPTFAMEIFSETWIKNGSPQGSIGWFVNPDIETEYYVLVWLPDVSIFTISEQNGEYLDYQPATVIDSVFSNSCKRAEFSKIKTSPPVYRIEVQRLVDAEFEYIPEPAPKIVSDDLARANIGEGYYCKQNIHEAKIAVIEKQKIVDALAKDGLDRDTLTKIGMRAITESSVSVDSQMVYKIMRSGDVDSGSGDGENPVIAVISYQTYHDLADRTYHYRCGEWRTNVRLF